MFGYVVINKPDMKIKDFETYKAFYCGLCNELNQKYGLKGRLTLNFDLTFLVILLSGLYETENRFSECKCIAHPLEKHRIITNEFTSYAADINILLTYYKCLDDWKDEKKLKKKLFADALKKSGRKAANKYPEKAAAIEECISQLSEYEKQNISDIDMVSGCFGKLMSELFVYKHDEWETYLSKIGFFLGKYIYILDAYIDLEKDEKEGNYNSLAKDRYSTDECREVLTMMMAECSKAFEMLPIIDYFDILENILYSGVWTAFNGGKPVKRNDLKLQQ